MWASHAFANSSRSRCPQRPYGSPSTLASATKRGIGRRTGGTAGTLPERLPQLGGGALGREYVELDAGRHLEARPDPDPRGDVEVPVKPLGAAGGGDRPGVQLRDPVKPRLERAERGPEHPEPDLVVALEAGSRVAGDDPQLERRARRPGADQQRVVVDRHQPLPAADLLRGDLGEQITAHSVLVVGGEALALARDGGRDEAERIQLGVAVLEGGAGLASLVDDQLHVGGLLRVLAHSRPPAGHRGGELGVVQLAERREVTRDVDDHLVEAGGGGSAEEIRLPPARGGAQRIPRRRQALAARGRRAARWIVRLALVESRIKVGDGAEAPAGGVGLAARRPVGPDLRRGAILAPLAEGTALRAAPFVLVGNAAELERAVRPCGREDRPQAGELVEPDLGKGLVGPVRHYRALRMRTCSIPASMKASPS